jgi:hypothetical protein
MPAGTSSETVVFQHPFVLEATGETWPAGAYEVETERQAIDGVLWSGGYRLETTIRRRDPARGVVESVRVDPSWLSSALEADARRGTADGPSPRSAAPDRTGAPPEDASS